MSLLPVRRSRRAGAGIVVQVLLWSVLSALLLAVAACGDNNSNETSAQATATIRPTVGATATTTTSVSPVASVTAPPNRIGAVQASPSALAATGAQVLTEVATDNKFSETSLTAKANTPITLTLRNEGQTVHNWHLLDVKDADGKTIATRLLEPGQSESIAFTITQPGTYHFQCDAHPQEMQGTLTIT